MSTRVLQQFGISSAELLGRGGESEVYALDPIRVVRIYPVDASRSYIEARRNFYTLLAAQNPAFVIPQVLDMKEVAGFGTTITNRKSERSLSILHGIRLGSGEDNIWLKSGDLDLVLAPASPAANLILPIPH